MAFFHRKKKKKSAKKVTEVDTNDADKVTFISKINDRINSFFDLLASSKHKKMERRALSFIIAIFLFISGSTIAVTHHLKQLKIQEATVDSAGAKANFSKNGTQLTLGNTHLSKDGKTAYIPITFGSMETLSTDANHYKVRIAAKHEPLTYKPTGTLILFGQSGFGLVELHSSTGIKNQPLHVAIWNEKTIKTADSDGNDAATQPTNGSAVTDKKKHDSVMFDVNPGSVKARHNHRVNATTKQPYRLYADIYLVKQMVAIDKQIAKDKKIISQQKETAAEQKRRLKVMGFKVPKDPKWMSNSWRPYDAYDSKTHKLKNGGDLATASDNMSPDDPDNVRFPDALKGPNGATTNDDTQQPAQQNSDSSTTNDHSSDAGDSWNELQNSWTAIRTAKRNMYVTEEAQRWIIESQAKRDVRAMSIMKSDRFAVFGKVKVVQNNKK